jgi:hypothetical protein
MFNRQPKNPSQSRNHDQNKTAVITCNNSPNLNAVIPPSHTQHLYSPTLNGIPLDTFRIIQSYLNVNDAYRLSNVSNITRAKINWGQFGFLNRAAFVEKQRAIATAPQLINVLLLGDSTLKKRVSGTSSATTGIDYNIVSLSSHKIKMWDLAAHDRNGKLSAAYMKNTQVVVIFASSQEELHNLSGKLVACRNNITIVLAHPENLSLNTRGLGVNKVFPLTKTNCGVQQLAYFIAESLKPIVTEQAASCIAKSDNCSMM